MTLQKWLRRAAINEDVKPGQSRTEAAEVPVTVTRRVLKGSRHPYCRWLQNPITPPREVVEAYRANTLIDTHTHDPEFGHRPLADEARDAGESMSDRTAWKITPANDWFRAFGKPRVGRS